MMRARLCVKTGHLINRYNTKGWQAPVICASLSLMAVCSYILYGSGGSKKRGGNVAMATQCDGLFRSLSARELLYSTWNGPSSSLPLW